MRVCVIPARGGSKRIPRKNIKEFVGKPMIAWSIEAAKNSGCFDRIIVSTDDVEIAQVARDYGAEIPFMRPAELADDYADTLAVMHHVIQALEGMGCVPDVVCCLYATAPFVLPSDLRKGEQGLRGSGAEYALSVTEFGYPIQRAVKLRDGRLEMFQPECYSVRSQDLEEAWHDAGQFYWGRRQAWLDGLPLLSRASVPVVLPSFRVQDIDTTSDWVRAELMFKLLLEEGVLR